MKSPKAQIDELKRSPVNQVDENALKIKMGILSTLLLTQTIPTQPNQRRLLLSSNASNPGDSGGIRVANRRNAWSYLPGASEYRAIKKERKGQL